MIKRHRPVNKSFSIKRLYGSASLPRKIAWGAILLFAVFILTAGSLLLLNRQPQTANTLQMPNSIPHNITQQMPNPLNGIKLYVNPTSNAVGEANKLRDANPDQAKKFDKLAKVSTGIWATSLAGIDIAKPHIQAAGAEGSAPVLVSYNFPNRDCGSYSAGGAASPDEYKQFITTYAAAIGQTKAIVIIEPDAIAQTHDVQDPSCSNDPETRYDLLRYAVEQMANLPNTFVYLDAGNSRWVSDTNDMAARLTRAGIDKADGFSLNVSNFIPTNEITTYGQGISAKLGGKHFVIDTSRNGLGTYTNADFPEHNWCNPPGRALGHYPTTNTGNPLVDAFLYIKHPGESDGADPDVKKCFGGPKAGDWWPEYAVGLIERWPNELQPR